MKKRIFLFLTIFTFNFVFSQAPSFWYSYLGNVNFSQEITMHNELQVRNYDYGANLEQFMFRNGIGWNLTPSNNLLLGYAYIYSQPKSDNNANIENGFVEHRIFQQFITKQHYGRFNLIHRYRLEERFVKNDLKFRFRYWLAAQVALNKSTFEKGTIFLSLYNEVFLNLESTYFDRDRLYGAVGYILSDELKLEAGVLRQVFDQRATNHLQVTLFSNLNWERRK